MTARGRAVHLRSRRGGCRGTAELSQPGRKDSLGAYPSTRREKNAEAALCALRPPPTALLVLQMKGG